MLDFETRSEAHFAALLYSDLTSDTAVRDRFISEVGRRTAQPAGQIVDVLVEPAPFRDGWKALDEKGRRLLIDQLLQRVGSQIRPGQFDWMLSSKGKLRSPATWHKDKVTETDTKLHRLCFIFRARADLLVMTTSMALWVELKVESKTPAVRADSYHQKTTQHDIAEFAPMVINELQGLRSVNLLIQRRSSKEPFVAAWSEIVVRDLPHWKSHRLLFPAGPKT